MSRRHDLRKLPDAAIAQYLSGRPHDPRVKYATGIPRGKAYPTPRQKRERAMMLAAVAAEQNQVLVTDDAPVGKEGISE